MFKNVFNLKLSYNFADRCRSIDNYLLNITILENCFPKFVLFYSLKYFFSKFGLNR